MKDYDLINNPWFIRINSEEESHAVWEWLVVNYGSYARGAFWNAWIKGVTNVNLLSPRTVMNYWVWMDSGDILMIPEEYEIKLEFELKVKSVTFPEETQEQKEIKRLKSIIKDAQESLDEIYKGGQK